MRRPSVWQAGRARFVSGDWECVSEMLTAEQRTHAARRRAGLDSTCAATGVRGGSASSNSDANAVGAADGDGNGDGNAAGNAAGAADGDAGATSQHVEGCSGPFELILSSETIYSLESTARLWRLLAVHLAPGGVALIAAKSYYFGVGGSVAAFQALVAAEGAPDFAWRAGRTSSF